MLGLPIVIDDHGDIWFYSSVEAAERSLEAVDVENDEYCAYDSDGLVLNLRSYYVRSIGLVKIEPTDDCRADELRQKLIDYFSSISIKVDANETLHRLIRIARSYIHE